MRKPIPVWSSNFAIDRGRTIVTLRRVYSHGVIFFGRNALSKRKLPDYRLKQKILYIDKTSPETLVRYGDSYLEENALSDALEFYIRAEHAAGLENIKNISMDQGDVFLYQSASRALKSEIRKNDWEDLARRAIDLKKYSFAQYALEKTGNTELLHVLATNMKAEATDKHS